MATLPRGIRNNSPGNIRHGDQWQGLASRQTDKDFCQFVSPEYGIRALAKTLITYQSKHGLKTIRTIISRWAPPNENNTSGYIAGVAKQCGKDPDDPVDTLSYSDLRPIVESIIRHENGAGPMQTANTWYDAATIDRGLALAGVIQKEPT